MIERLFFNADYLGYVFLKEAQAEPSFPLVVSQVVKVSALNPRKRPCIC